MNLSYQVAGQKNILVSQQQKKLLLCQYLPIKVQ